MSTGHSDHLKGDPYDLQLGDPIPRREPHALSVHLPTWKDTLGWASRQADVVGKMTTGYPRFFIHHSVVRLTKRIILEVNNAKRHPNDDEWNYWYSLYRNGPLEPSEQSGYLERMSQWPLVSGSTSSDNEYDSKDMVQSYWHGLLFSTTRHAQMCCRFLKRQKRQPTEIQAWKVFWNLARPQPVAMDEENTGSVSNVQKTGSDSDSKRGASGEKQEVPDPEPGSNLYLVMFPASCLELVAASNSFWQHTGFGISSRRASHWLKFAPFLSPPQLDFHRISEFHEFRHWNAKTTIKQRISSALLCENHHQNIWLFPSGMAAIAEAAAAVQLARRSPCAIAVFGFAYVDTLKILQKVFGFKVVLYKYSESEIDRLEDVLRSGTTRIGALFTEFPGNPLLQCPNLPRLRTLSEKHDFLLIVDDTIGTSANVHILSHCDVVCTSLSKMFSGKGNVMGGSLAVSLNYLDPTNRYIKLKAFVSALNKLQNTSREHGDNNGWFFEDVITMEHNSADYWDRVHEASATAEYIADKIRHVPCIARLYYPKGGDSQRMYDAFRITNVRNMYRDDRKGGYGFLMSIRFTRPAYARTFYDALTCAKGPSLGTNFTLCCAYTLLAHYNELEVAKEHGVVEDLVRISFGLEDKDRLLGAVVKALRIAYHSQSKG
ncbi:putative cystathionine gamma-synthase/beta-lyase [Podospora didyma]|uniref:Cystathionine gamma-synthase/beta-lyase n=1 Tax=Podospora didyma TaxID=330526 RepID=A0AAE0NPE0_9PEZI|nr:putative cystathionine gamma-synthase/beta-lyase [Podospora didyma]